LYFFTQKQQEDATNSTKETKTVSFPIVYPNATWYRCRKSHCVAIGQAKVM
jgi:hypothetical protein